MINSTISSLVSSGLGIAGSKGQDQYNRDVADRVVDCHTQFQYDLQAG